MLCRMKTPQPASAPASLLFDRLSMPAPTVDFTAYQPLLQTAHLLLPPAFCRCGLLALEVQAKVPAATQGLSPGISLQLWLGTDVLEISTPAYMAATDGELLHARLTLTVVEGTTTVAAEVTTGQTHLLTAWTEVQSLPALVLGGRHLRLNLKAENVQPMWVRAQARVGER